MNKIFLLVISFLISNPVKATEAITIESFYSEEFKIPFFIIIGILALIIFFSLNIVIKKAESDEQNSRD